MEMDRHRFDRHLVAPDAIYPRAWPEGPSLLHAECLIEGMDPRVEVLVRFEQTVGRDVLDAAGEPIEELLVTGRRHRAGEERVEHEVQIVAPPGRTAMVATARSEQAGLIEGGVRMGSLRWRWEPLHATVEAWIDSIAPGLHRVRVDVANRLEWDGGPRRRALMRALRSTHLLMHSPDGAFASPIAAERLVAAA